MKKHVNQKLKLKLDKQTVRSLTQGDLVNIAGGFSSDTLFNTCGHCNYTFAYGCGAGSSATM
jgi:hypothetical protein